MMEVEAAVFWYKQALMRNDESTLPGLTVKGTANTALPCLPHDELCYYKATPISNISIPSVIKETDK